MKKNVLILFVMFTGTLAAQEAQKDNKVYKNIFTTTVTSLTVSTFQLNYERALNDGMALKFSAGVKYKDKVSDYKAGVNGELQFKYYLLSPDRAKTFYNIYFAPYLNYHYTKVITDDYTIRGDLPQDYFWGFKTFYFHSISAGVIFGQTFTLGKKVFIDLYVGGGLKKNLFPDEYFEEYSSNILKEGYSGITGKIGLDIGFKF